MGGELSEALCVCNSTKKHSQARRGGCRERTGPVRTGQRLYRGSKCGHHGGTPSTNVGETGGIHVNVDAFASIHNQVVAQATLPAGSRTQRG